jgi:predicted nucleotidyltransferase
MHSEIVNSKKGLLNYPKNYPSTRRVNMRAREGDLIRTKSNVVFDVKGTIHPPDRIIAFPRFIQQADGARVGKGGSFGKVYSLGDRFKYLQENHPDLIVFDPIFGETLCEVPTNQIAELYQPTEKLGQLRTAKNLTPLEKKALQLAVTLKEKADIPWSSIGISGSIMAGLTTATSDIDPLVYGKENSRKAYTALQELRSSPNSGFKPYTRNELKNLYDFRSKDTQMSFEDFLVVESRKAFQGMFMGTDYFIRFVKDWIEISEQYGDVCFQNSGYCTIVATAVDSQDALFTPCTYRLGNVEVLEGPKLAPISEVVSFRGRFCEQAIEGERIEAQGKVELVSSKKSGSKYYRLILGNKPQDYMVLKH